MGDKRRFDKFADLIVRNFPKARSIADVAGGKGALQQALRELGVPHVVTFDKRRGRKDRPRMRYQYRYFDSGVNDHFDLLVGMHPDEATDVIIDEAAKRKVPFLVCPCCEKPTASAYFGGDWCNHLMCFAERKGMRVQRLLLPICGKNVVLRGTHDKL